MTRELLAEIVAAQRSGTDVVLATRIADGAQELVRAGAETGAGALEAGADEVSAVIREGRPRTVGTPGGDVFLRPYLRPPRLIVVGAVHIAQALVPMATIAGFSVTVIDPRQGFAAQRPGFPDAALLREWPDDRHGRPRARRPHGAGGTHPRSAHRRSGADRRAREQRLLHRRAGQPQDAGGAPGPPRRRGLLAERTSPASTGPSAFPSARSHPEEIAVAVLAQAIAALRGAVGTTPVGG